MNDARNTSGLSRRTLLGAVPVAAALTAAGIVTGAPAAVAATGGPLSVQLRFTGLFREVADQATVPAAARRDYGATPASVMWFDNFGSGNPFPVTVAQRLWTQGVMAHYTWEPWYPEFGAAGAGQIGLADVVGGKWDDYIAARGKEFASFGQPMIVRYMHEFNGNWYPWAIANNGEDPTLYVKAFRHVHDLVTAQGATNVQWCWAFNDGASPVAPWNAEALAYPGAAYVDWVGVDGYNWGFSPPWDPGVDHWVSFHDTFAAPYALARSIDPSKPVMIPEFASAEAGGNKAKWLRDMIATLRAPDFPNLKLLTYFDIIKEEPWALNSNVSGIAQFVGSGGRQSWFRGNGSELAQVANNYIPLPD